MNIIETERLTIRWLIEDDAEFIYRLYNTDSFLQFVGDKNLQTIDDARKYLLTGALNMYERIGMGLYMVELKSDKTALGISGLIKRDSLNDIDIGYGFLPEFEGKGYAYEAGVALKSYAKDALKIERLVAITTADNKRSITLLEKLGLDFESTVEEPDNQPALRLYAMHL
ncbi:N-acetyltransferase [Photobacterium profundum]|uniref:Acetyltransferase, GNAT family protein n=1 Tax=Photobacterium profundum 3TCK TaxID=314280 RepID=Q1ZAG2_9GAMM|nr:GNAT family N-acetyltransferase [Photobacterium profundum]EAS45530.1 acetyltransferase, GNAT family protein [Photobacterium profundum 3TCK]PSV63294.1 N-acetyltransferase [Photobacterium profundum]